MTDLAGLSAVLNIIDGLSGTVAALKKLRDAPSQVEDFELQSTSFCDNLIMFYEIANQHIPQLKEKASVRMLHANGLIKLGQRVEKGLKELLGRLESLCDGAIGPVKSLMRLWEKVLWVLQQNYAERLKTNMNLATVQISCFMNMLVLEIKLATPVEDVASKETQERQM
jgi:hypothetical protein